MLCRFDMCLEVVYLLRCLLLLDIGHFNYCLSNNVSQNWSLTVLDVHLQKLFFVIRYDISYEIMDNLFLIRQKHQFGRMYIPTSLLFLLILYSVSLCIPLISYLFHFFLMTFTTSSLRYNILEKPLNAIWHFLINWAFVSGSYLCKGISL